MQQKERFPKTIRLGRRMVGEGCPAYFIADIGANFDGSLAKAKELARAAKEAGADAVKFQSFLAEKIVSGPSFSKLRLKGIHGSWKKPIPDVFKDAEFPRAWHQTLFEYCKGIGTTFVSSPYDTEAVDLLDRLPVPFFKIGSGEITWYEMLRYIARKKKPVILATGDSTLAEVDEAVRVIEEAGNRNLILLQCVTNYPSQVKSANIKVLQTYQAAFDVLTGYSDHTQGDTVVLGSVALGGVVFEKHFTLRKTDAGPDHPHSMEPQEFKNMVERVRLLEQALGSGRKELVAEEAETVVVQRRSLHAVRDLQKGEHIHREDIVELRPAVGIPPRYKEVLIGKCLIRNVKSHEALHWTDF